MGIWRAVAEFFGMPTRTFSESDPRPIDQVIYEMSGRGSSPTVGRIEALSVPAVQRGRNLICSISTLPLVQHGPKRETVRNPLFEQLDPDVANVVTLAQTVEDLLLDAVAWWRITAFGWDGFPVSIRHLDVSTVSVDPPKDRSPAPLPSGLDPREGVIWVDGKPVPGSEIIRFDSPNPALLKVGGRAIRRAILLDKAAAMYADDPQPAAYFTPAEGADPADDDDVRDMLADWKRARKERSTAYVPAALRYNSVDAPSPADLQLVQLQKQAGLDIANALGVDPEELGISTTSRTYNNATDRRRDRINDVLAPFMRAITDRLSMGDVTKRGHRVVFDLDDYMKADPITRWTVYEKAKALGVFDAAGIAAEEGLPDPPAGAAEPKPTPTPEPAAEPAPVDAAARPAGMTFADDQRPAMTFDGGDFAGGTEPAKVDVERRTITGLAVPYNKIARKYGMAFRFRPGSLQYADVSRIKHLMDHYKPVGVTASVEETRKGPVVKLQVLDGPEGSPAKLERDQLLYDAKHGLYDGLSVGVDFSLDSKAGDVEWNEKDQVYDVLRADWRETSSTPMPAFDDARVTKVSASRDGRNPGMPEQENEPTTQAQTTPPATGGLNLNEDQVTALLTRPGAIEALVRQQQTPVQPATPQGALTLSADQVDALIKSGGLGTLLGVPQLTQARQEPEPEQRQTVNPVRRTVTASVDEGMPYRFDRQGNLARGKFDFSTDLIAGSQGDHTALERAQTFMREQFDDVMRSHFDTDRADVGALNPSRQRPDMYVDQLSFRYPVWEAINKGTLADSTPFVLPKFNTASGLVANHTEGTEPTAGTYTATSQTITPTAVSGKVEITREAWEQGGNPQLSGIIWRQMTKAWFEALEAAAVAVLDAATPTAIALTTGGGTTGQTLSAELTAAFASLQFIRGGFSMSDMFTQVDLYKALIAAKDNDGRALYPALGPSNASGTAASRYAAIDVNGVTALPAWALAASGAVSASSYLFDREVVHGWASAPQRLQFEYRVAYVDLAIWGYKATAITDITGVREITYDPTA